MSIYRRLGLSALAVFITAVACFGDEPAPAKFYKLEFVVKQLDGGKTVSSKTYRTMVSTKDRTSIRTGTKVPFVTAKSTDGKGESHAAQFQQVYLGVNIDIDALKEAENRLWFNLTVDISSLGATSPTVPEAPLIRLNKWSTAVSLAFKKPTVVVASDDVDAKTQMEVEVTAEPFP